VVASLKHAVLTDLTRLAVLAKKHAQRIVYVLVPSPPVLKVAPAVEESIEVVIVPVLEDPDAGSEVVAFFRGLAKGKFKAEPIFFQAQGDLVVDIHRGWSNVGSGLEVDQLYALMFRIRDGKIVEAQNFLTDMYSSDAFYWAHYPLKKLPGRLADER
jgi:predicted SnoaL-like aldol condensation-catalyzing enzyme